MKFIHCADLHLDSKMDSLPSEKAKIRREEVLSTFERLADYASKINASAVIIAGDMFDTSRTTLKTRGRVLEAICKNSNVDFLYLSGNHDDENFVSELQSYPNNFKVFTDDWQSFCYSNIVISGVKVNSINVSTIYDTLKLDENNVNIVTLHGQIADYKGEEQAEKISLPRLKNKYIDYLALGHIHEDNFGKIDERGVWAQSGCLEGRGFDELGEKGLLVGTVEQGKADLEFVPLCRRRYRIIEADVTGRSLQETMENALTAVDEDICRVILTGETTDETPDLAALERDFAGHCYFLQLRDETRVARDIWERAGEDSLRGLFLSELRRRYDAAADEEERKKIDLAVRFGLAALDGRDIG